MAKVDIENFSNKDFIRELPTTVQQLDAVRAGTPDLRPVDLSLGDFLEETYGLSKDAYFEKLGVNPRQHTMQNLFTMPDSSIRWLIPEIIREAIDLGMKSAPFYPTLITSDQSISGLSAIMPFVNTSDAVPAKVNEAETIPLGDVSFGQKMVKLFKVGRGFKLTDEVKNYVSLDVMSLFVKDFGTQLGYALDTLAIDTLINGNISDGSEAVPVLGVSDTSSGIQYKDLLQVWIRTSRLGRVPKTIISGESEGIALLDLPEFKDRYYGTTQATLNLKTPIPSSANYYIHAGIPSGSVMLVDQAAALIKLTARPLFMESERIVSNQTESIYASITTGFSKMYQDATLLLDGSKAFSTYGFPSYMEVNTFSIKNL